MNIETRHDIFEVVGKLRLAFIFRRYDYKAKGFLDSSDFARMISDIEALGQTWQTQYQFRNSVKQPTLNSIIATIKREHQCVSLWSNRLSRHHNLQLEFSDVMHFQTFVYAVDRRLIQ